MIEYPVSDPARLLARSSPLTLNGRNGTHLKCEPSAAAAEPAPCEHQEEASCKEPLRLNEALDQFAKEAQLGTCDTGRYEMPYYVWGSGPPLLFVHGLCDDARSFLLPIARLSRYFRCIAYDLPTGRQDGALLGAYRHPHFVDDLFALLDHLKLERAHVFGSSFGSTIALAAMHKQPARFERAVLQGGFARRPLAATEVLLARWARYWPWNMQFLPFRQRMLQECHYRIFESRGPEFWQFFLDRDFGNPMNAVAHRALILHRTDLRRLLPGIAHPVLMICGDCDPLVGKECELELEKSLRNVIRIEIESCGHMPHFTHPEVLAEVVRRFCKM